jgi:ATP-dependent protease ClpP protease subunit
MNLQNNHINKTSFINSAIIQDNVGRIDLYGTVYESHPVDWWTGEKIEGDFICLDDFRKSLDEVKKCTRLELHLNSYGGDATVGLTMRNLIKALNKPVTCIVDGIAASAAFTIASGCDEVQVYKGSIMMCHKVMSLLFGFYNNDDLQQAMNGNEAYDKASAAVYAAKTGMSEQQCLNLMSKVTWMTGEQAINYGFADTLLEGDAKVEIVDNNTIKTNGIEQKLRLNIPEEVLQNIRANNSGGNEVMAENLLEKFQKHMNAFFSNSESEDKGAEEEDNQQIAEEQSEQPAEEGGEQEQASEQGAEAPAEEEKENVSELIAKNVADERKRLQEIDALAKESNINADLVNEAKYGETACNAAELAMRQMQFDSKKKDEALENLEKDNSESKSNDVSSVPGTLTMQNDKEVEDAERKNAVNDLFSKLGIKAKEDKEND